MVTRIFMASLMALSLAALSSVSAQAQSMNINYGGQASYSTDEVKNVEFTTAGKVLVNKVDGTATTFEKDEIKSMDFSNAPVDNIRKYIDDKPAQVVFSCIEVNNTNPLQTMNFKLAKANKLLFDAVILFSSNINFSKKENVVYIHNNDNVQAILNNYDHYIKPLKDRGIKVLLSILGNHDGSGLANMDINRCREFATAIADTLDKYDLDGVFFDDEYSEYNKDLGGQGFSGFQSWGDSKCSSRLAYETKKAIGKRWMVTYKYGNFNSLTTIDGVQPGQYIDYVLTDYGVVGTWSGNQSAYPGITKEQYGICSVNMGGYTNYANLKRNRTDGYGALMIYNLDQVSGNYGYVYEPALEKIVSTLFDDHIEVDPTPYRKDWKPVPGLSEPNR